MAVSFDEYLILQVEQHPNLYDKTAKEFKNFEAKRRSWQTIASNLDTDVETAIRRWENLRDRFVRVYRIATDDLPADFRSLRKSNYFAYFENMRWLGQHIRKRKSMPSSAAKGSDTVNDNSEYSQNSAGSIIIKEDDDNDDEDDEENKEELGGQSEDGYPAIDPVRTRKRFRVKVESPPLQQLPSALSYLMEQPVSSKGGPGGSEVNESSDMHFAKSLAGDMQLLTPLKKVKFKKDVMNILYKYVLEDD